MKKYIIASLTVACSAVAFSQETVYPAPAQTQTIALTNGTIHVGNGQVIDNGMVVISGGKILDVRPSTAITDVKVIDCKGKHIYPGMILSNVQLGLVEVSSVRATNDANEIGELNPNIRSIVAYNTDSKVINTVRNNGVLLANIIPLGGLLSGSSSVVQLDAWHWEDALYQADNGIHFRMPSLLGRRTTPAPAVQGQQSPADPVKRSLEQIEEIKYFFREARAYLQETSHSTANLKFEALKGLFSKNQKLFVHCNVVKEMLVAIDMAKEFGFDVVLVGAADCWQIADLLKQNNIAVILNQLHSLPTIVDDDVDQPYKTPFLLKKAGVLFAINDDDESTRYRNLAFNAGTAAAYGLTREEALTAVTLSPAQILGIADKTGSIEKGKDANIVVSDGDLLDMRTNNIIHAFIQGREIDLNDKQKQLYERYKYKYGIGK